MIRAQMGPWLADIAANVLAITLIVLIALARITSSPPPAPPSESLVPRVVPPLAGAEAVELLRQRLLPQSSGLVDVTGDPADVPDKVAALLILDPGGYGQVAATLSQRQTGWVELTVPEALKTDENTWDPAYLDLAPVAEDPARFRAALQDLLTERAQAGRGSALEGTGIATRAGRWVAVFLNTLGVLALTLALWALLRLRRWALTA